MTRNHLVELFVLKCAPLSASVETSLIRFDPSLAGSSASLQNDSMLREYLAQIPLEDRVLAERMSEYYKIFYAFENYVRDFVASVLDGAAPDGSDWWDAMVPDVIKDGARRSMERELAAGVTPRSAEMLEYTSFGELAEIIKANVPAFGGMIRSIKGLETVMARLNTLRGPIMHCGALAEDEVVRLKLSIRDWFKLFE